MARFTLIVLLSVCSLLGITGESRAQSVDSTLWGVGPSDKVFTVVRAGNTVYVGGNFAALGPNTGGGVPVNINSARGVPGFPRVAGRVDVVVPDGAGGWYIGGWFSAVSGHPQGNLAHLGPDGLDGAWMTTTNGEVFALALGGSSLYIGGDFDSLGGTARSRLAKVDARTGAVASWDPQVNDRVSTLLVSGTDVYAGGRFTVVGGQPHHFAAAIDSASGLPTAWDPAIDAEVKSIALYDTTLFLGGYFANVGGTLRRYLAAVSLSDGALLPWNADVNRTPDFIYDGGPRVAALLVRDSLLFVAGSFKTIGGQYREGLAAVSVTTAQASAWDPRAYSAIIFGAYFRALALSGDTLFVAGQADSLGGMPGSYLAAMSTSTATRLNWDPRPNWEVFALSRSGCTLYAGGGFSSLGDWVQRRNLAAFDATTGALKGWDPEADDYVNSIVVVGNAVYVGGVFSSVGGQQRADLAALDANSGLATPWNPTANGAVNSLGLWKSTVLVGGWFSSIGGQSRNNLAAVDTASGLATAWDPDANDIVNSVVPSDSVIYVGGWFSSIGGQSRATLAAVDPVSGAPTPWAPTTDGVVRAIAATNGVIHVGGAFHSVSGVPRDNIAAIDVFGSAMAWTANASGEVRTLARSDSTIYVGGFFTSVGGCARTGIAGLNARTAIVDAWNPAPDGSVWGLSASDGTLYAVGTFGRVGDWPHSGIAAIALADASTPGGGATLALAQNAPNPAGLSTIIRYALPRAASVNLSVFDIQGRRVATVLFHSLQMAGSHQVSVRTNGWRAGCYLYRLEADGKSATRKMIVVR